MEQEVKCVDDDIAVLVVHDRRVRRLLTIPGVGLTTAAAVVAVVGDVLRLERPTKLVGYKYKLLEVKAGIASPARLMGQGVFARDTMVQARKVLANAERAHKMTVSARQVQEGLGRLNEGTTRRPQPGSATEISPSNSALCHEVDRA